MVNYYLYLRFKNRLQTREILFEV